MKLVLLVAAAIVSVSTGFVVNVNQHQQSSSLLFRQQQQQITTRLQSSSSSSSDAAIAAAQEASTKYGSTSPEARVAWDIVEELNSADNSAALGGSLDVECELDENMNAASVACQEYEAKMIELQSILDETTLSKVQKVKNLAQEMKAIKLNFPTSSTKKEPATQTPEMKLAYEKAVSTQEQYGKGSIEAKLAWLELEEIASSGLGNAIGGPYLDSENCALEETSIDACIALQEVNRVLAVKSSSDKN